MPALSNMNEPVVPKLATEKIIEAKLLADSMLDDIFSNLRDVKRTALGVRAMLYIIVETPAIHRMMSFFFRKIKKSTSYLSSCSVFQKRMLLFSIVECLMSGKNIELRFTTERLTPLETVLQRLQDVSIACEEEFDKDELEKIYIQTIKQSIIMFLKNDQPVEASKVLVINRHRLNKEYQDLLQEFIDEASKSKDVLDGIERMPEHDYPTYCAAVVDFLEGLNANLKESTLENLRKFASNVIPDHTGETEDNPSEDDSDNEEALDHSELAHSLPRTNSPTPSSEIGSGKENILESENVMERENQSINASADVSEQLKEKKDEDGFNISPKMSLTYRLKKQTHKSGVITPCQYIIEHCRKVNDEQEDKENEGTFQVPHSKVKQTTSTPIRGAAFKQGHVHRNYRLGERFEDLNVSVQSTTGRSYSKRKKLLFTLELDSYILAGCQRFGVGQWSQILNSFPFPEDCTNVKIKDRFRTLIKLNYIAILDDGDFNVLNVNLKSKIAPAMEKMKRQGYSASSMNKQAKSSKEHDRAKERVQSSGGTGEQSVQSDALSEREIEEVSSSGSFESREVPGSRSEVKFTPTEDAYLLCGARHLGQRWNILKEYFDFQAQISASHMQERWDELIAQGKIEVPDEDGSVIYCHDVSLENRCMDVTNRLKKKIQKQRKSFANAMGNEELTNSESSESSVVPQTKSLKRKRSKRRVVESLSSDDNAAQDPAVDDKQSSFKMPEPVPPPRLNKSIDAGTQTKKQRVALRRRSPSLLDCESSASELEVERGNHDGSSVGVGSPIRPSMINLFKRERVGKRRKRERTNSFVTETRERRQRELSRRQRKKVPVKKTTWNDVETRKLIDGVKKFGQGKWSQILDHGYDIFKDRTSVMIKDKFRTLQKQGLITDEMLAQWEAERSNSSL